MLYRSWYLWIHVGLSIMFVPIAIIIMRHFSKRLDIPEEDSAVSRTLMINHIPRSRCSKADLLKHFKYIVLDNSFLQSLSNKYSLLYSEAYPEYEVIDIQFAYNLSKLIKLDRARLDIITHKSNYKTYLLLYLQTICVACEKF